MKSLVIVPMEFDEACAFVRRHHRHHKPPIRVRFSVGLTTPANAAEAGLLRKRPEIIGVAMIGRPVARLFDDGWTVEIVRCATDGTKNACSALYRAAARASFAMGYRRVITYTRTDESGASLRGAGYTVVAKRPKQSWDRPSRPRVDKSEPHERLLWELVS